MIGEPIMEADMDDKLTVDLDRETMEALSRQAKEHGHSVNVEAREILKRNVRAAVPGDRQAIIAEFRRIRAMTPVGVRQTSSVQLIREDRDR